MRTIKFRAWDKNNKIMDEDAHKSDMFYDMTTLPDYYHVMQFTGLLDKNGKEIYEGDILKGGMKVEYKNDCFVVEYNKNDWSSVSWVIQRLAGVEVIGNIYENQELLSNK